MLNPAAGRLADGPLSTRKPIPIGRSRPMVLMTRVAEGGHHEERTITPFSLTCKQLLLITEGGAPVSPANS